MAENLASAQTRSIFLDLEIREEAGCLRIRQGTRKMAPVSVVPLIVALFFLWQVLVLGGVRVARGVGPSSGVAGYVVVAAFVGLAGLMLLLTGWMRWVSIDRARGIVTFQSGALVPFWTGRRQLTEFFRVPVSDFGTGPERRWQVWLEGRGNPPGVLLATFRSPEEAQAFAERAGQFAGISAREHAARRLEEQVRNHDTARPRPELELTRREGRVVLRLQHQKAEWSETEFTRGLLHAMTPAKGPGEISLTGVTPTGRRVLVAWERFDEAAWVALCEGAGRLREVFPDGLEISEGADA